MPNAPDTIRTRKLNGIEPRKYCGGGPHGNPRCWMLFHTFCYPLHGTHNWRQKWAQQIIETFPVLRIWSGGMILLRIIHIELATRGVERYQQEWPGWWTWANRNTSMSMAWKIHSCDEHAYAYVPAWIAIVLSTDPAAVHVLPVASMTTTLPPHYSYHVYVFVFLLHIHVQRWMQLRQNWFL